MDRKGVGNIWREAGLTDKLGKLTEESRRPGFIPRYPGDAMPAPAAAELSALEIERIIAPRRINPNLEVSEAAQALQVDRSIVAFVWRQAGLFTPPRGKLGPQSLVLVTISDVQDQQPDKLSVDLRAVYGKKSRAPGDVDPRDKAALQAFYQAELRDLMQLARDRRTRAVLKPALPRGSALRIA